MICFFISCIFTSLVVILYEIWLPFSFVLGIFLYITILFVSHYWQRARLEAAEYYDATAYLEQLLCSYKRFGQLKQALEDCCSVFSENGKMGNRLKQALHILKTGEDVMDKNIARTALKQIESGYKSRRMETIHDFLCEAEQTGGNREDAIEILIQDLQMWKQRTALYQKQKGYLRTETAVAIVLAIVMCYVSRFLTPDELGIDLTETMLYQFTTCMVFFAFFLSLILVWKKLTGSWIDCYEQDDKKILDRKKRLYCILKGELKANCLQKHLAQKICRREVEVEYPYWLLNMSLKLQTESVYNAAKQSIQGRCGILADEVRNLIQNIYQEPMALRPYTEFFKELRLPEVQSGMKILYSITQNGFDESGRQINFLIAQNNQLIDRAEKKKYENQTAGLGLLKHLPMMLACVKLLADLVNLLMLTMGAFQNIL